MGMPLFPELPGWLSLIGVIVIGYLNLRSQREEAERTNLINDKLEALRRDIDRQYVPRESDTVQRASLTDRISTNEKEITKNRDRIHDLSNQMSTLIMGKLDRIENQLVDKVRRMTNIESKLESLEVSVHELTVRAMER